MVHLIRGEEIFLKTGDEAMPTGNNGCLASLGRGSNGKYSNTKHIFSEGNRHDCGVREKWLKENSMLVHCIGLH